MAAAVWDVSLWKPRQLILLRRDWKDVFLKKGWLGGRFQLEWWE